MPAAQAPRWLAAARCAVRRCAVRVWLPLWLPLWLTAWMPVWVAVWVWMGARPPHYPTPGRPASGLQRQNNAAACVFAMAMATTMALHRGIKHLACAVMAAAAARRHPSVVQQQVKTMRASAHCMLDVAVRNPVAEADDHGAVQAMAKSGLQHNWNANDSQSLPQSGPPTSPRPQRYTGINLAPASTGSTSPLVLSASTPRYQAARATSSGWMISASAERALYASTPAA